MKDLNKICPKCNKVFLRASSIGPHLKNSCIAIKTGLFETVQNLKNELKNSKESIELIHQHYREEINSLKESNLRELNSLEEKCRHEFCDYKDHKLDKYENHILKEKNINITNTSNNTTNNLNLAPYILTRELLKEICKTYTFEHFGRGPNATYNFVADRVLRDLNGIPRIKCTDTDRKMFKGICSDGEEFVDIGGKKQIFQMKILK